MSVSPPTTMLAAAAVAAGAAWLRRRSNAICRRLLAHAAAASAYRGDQRCRRRARGDGGAMSTEQVVERPVKMRADVAALLAGLVTVTLWGSAFVAIRDVGKSISPGSVALGRLLVSLVVLGIAAAIWREPLPRRRDLLLIAAFGVLFLGVYSFVCG
jgi:MYXO-CTERM domain-containing protein